MRLRVGLRLTFETVVAGERTYLAEARASLQHRDHMPAQVPANPGLLVVPADPGLAMPAVSAAHPIVAISITADQALGEFLGGGFRPAPAHQLGASVEEAGNVDVGPGTVAPVPLNSLSWFARFDPRNPCYRCDPATFTG